MKITVNTRNGRKHHIEVTAGQTILEALLANGITEVGAPCGGRGRCGKCTVFVEGEGEVLACTTPVCEGMRVFTYYPEETGETGPGNTAAPAGDGSMAAGHGSVIAEHGRGFRWMPDGGAALVAACDIGTTTVVCHLLDGETGEKLATASAPNAQRGFGADVLSRVQAADAGHLWLLQELIAGQICGMLDDLRSRIGRKEEIARLAISGNTVMSHLLAGISPTRIGVTPFMPEEYFGRSFEGRALGIPVREVYIAPAVAGFVGGDITADLLAVMEGHEGEETLLLDIGTNGEMAVGHGGSFLCCATAVGSAFEGAELTMGMPASTGAIAHVHLDARRIRVEVIGGVEAIGICGSGLLDALAILLQMGLVDERGLIKETKAVSVAYRRYLGVYEGHSCVWLTPQVCLTQEDIRDLQLAKAAFAAGMNILLRERGINCGQIDRVVICGGFGSFMDRESAAAIGLIPPVLLPVTESVGNAAGEGAVSAALSGKARQKLSEIQKSMRYIELSTHPDFAEEYMQQMEF